MTFDVLDDNFWVPDHEEWGELNKQNLAERKEEWKKIQPSLKELARLRRNPSGYLSVHKSLFFKGVLPEPEKIAIKDSLQTTGIGGASDKLFFSFPLFYFWYHPKLTSAVIEAMFARFIQPPIAVMFKDKVTATAIKASRETYFKLQGLHRGYDEYGIMGGREELLAPYFILGSRTGTAENAYRTGWFGPSCRGLLRQMMTGMSVLSGKKPYKDYGIVYARNPLGMGQFVWPQVSHYLQRHFINELSDPESANIELDLKLVENMVQKVLFFDDHPKAHRKDSLAIACRDRILGQYRNGELADWLSERFAQREQRGLEIL